MIKSSVKVKLVVTDDQDGSQRHGFDIEAELWAQPLPLRLFLRTEIDLETGGVKVSEANGQRG